MADQKKNEWKEIERKMQVRKGEKPGWLEVKIGEKKFIMKEVRQFYSERTEAGVDDI